LPNIDKLQPQNCTYLKNCTYSTMKVTAILKGIIDQNGQQPIQIRIYNNGKRTFRPTHLKVDPKQFKKGKIVDHPKAGEWNEKVKNMIIQYQAQALSGFEKKVPKVKLIDYVKSKSKHLDREDSTRRQYNVQIKKLTDFEPNVYLDEIDHSYFNRYKSYLKGLGNEGNTIWNSFKFLKTFIKAALGEGLITKDPRKNYEFPVYVPPMPTYLEESEIKKFEKFRTSKACNEKLFEITTWFLIAINTGFRISDIKSFNKEQRIKNNRIVFKTQKTGTIVGIPISPKLKAYFKDVNYKALSCHENTYNSSLKLIATMIGVKKNISSHVARHTAGMMLADAGVSMEVAAEILGHSGTKHTAVYYKITNKRIDLELKKLKQ
jgi:site-specific recombinase XerD